MDRSSAGIVGVLLGAALGCASSTQPAVSAAARELHGVDCPDDRVEVLETRDTDDDTLYVVDACGKKLELTKGYALPQRKSDLGEYSAESGFELPEGMRSSVPGGVTAIVRKKIQRWCRPASDPNAIAYSAGSLDECRAQLEKNVLPVGTQPGENGEPDIYWFALGKHVFTVREAFSSAGAPARQVAARTTPHSNWDERIWYARIELGTGYLNTSRVSTEGGSFHFRPQFGLKVNNDLAFGVATANHVGFANEIPLLYEIGLATSYYPIPEAGLRLEGAVSASFLKFADREYGDAGPLFSAAIGYDDGARKKNNTGKWSGAGLSVRGFYATFPGDDDATSVALYLSWYSW
ncbi:MAG TPA: hypothetical protein VFZ53_08575 [Polyangiaceae bacterium]